MKQGAAILLFLVVIYLIAEASPKGAAMLAAIVGLLLYSQLPKQSERS